MNTKYMEELELELNEQTIPIIEQISEGMPGGFFIYHADGNEELIFFNKAMLRIFGCDSKEEFRQQCHLVNFYIHMVRFQNAGV